MTIKIDIKGIPKAKQSFKYTRTGIKYRPKGVSEEQDSIRSQAISQLPPGFVPFGGPVEMLATFIFPPLKSMNKKTRQEISSGVIVPKTTKPDRGNLMKLLEDALEGVVYINDSQVWKSHEKKIYGDVPGIRILIKGE